MDAVVQNIFLNFDDYPYICCSSFFDSLSESAREELEPDDFIRRIKNHYTTETFLRDMKDDFVIRKSRAFLCESNLLFDSYIEGTRAQNLVFIEL